MAIGAADIEYRLSGGAGNSDVDLSLGGVMSTTQVVTATLHNLFDQVSGDEASAGDTEYRAIYLLNDHATLTWQNVFLWISTESGSTDSQLDLALAGEGLNTAMETVADESTAPVGETFTHITTKATGLSMGNIPATQFFGFWIRRVIGVAAAAFDTDTAILTTEGETAA